MKTIWLSGGLHWHLFKPLRSVPGVRSVLLGYAGGTDPQPTHDRVAAGDSDHRFAVCVDFDETVLSTGFLLERFWPLIDPTDPTGQFRDRGNAYAPAIHYADETMRSQVNEAVARLAASRTFERPVAVHVLPQTKFVPATASEATYPEDFPSRVELHDRKSGRAEGLLRLWKTAYDPKTLAQTLSPIAYRVTQHQATEPPFRNAYWNEFEDGIYVDVVSGEPLFSSLDKFDAGCGWPSFSKPIGVVRTKHDGSYGMIRTEVRTTQSDIHLGHVFDDGPLEAGGLRYCINSAALRFVPKDKLVEEGYGPYLDWFSK